MNKKKSKYFLLCAAIAAGLFAQLRSPEAASDAVKTALGLCGGVLLPSLFPYFVFSSLIVESGLAEDIGRRCAFFMRPLFGLPGSAAPAFILGLISGYPVGAKTAVSLYENGLCSKREAERLLAFCNNSGPAFVITAVGSGVFGSLKAGLLLLAAHTLSAVTVGLIMRLPSEKSGSAAAAIVRRKRPPISRAITKSIRDSADSFLAVCSYVVFFAIIIALLKQCGALSALSSAAAQITGAGRAYFDSLFYGLIELITGVSSLPPTGEAIALAGGLIGFAGAAVHFQVLGVVAGSGLSPKPYLLGKTLQGFIGALYSGLFSLFLPKAAIAGANFGEPLFAASFPAAAALAAALVILCAVAFKKTF